MRLVAGLLSWNAPSTSKCTVPLKYVEIDTRDNRSLCRFHIMTNPQSRDLQVRRCLPNSREEKSDFNCKSPSSRLYGPEETSTGCTGHNRLVIQPP